MRTLVTRYGASPVGGSVYLVVAPVAGLAARGSVRFAPDLGVVIEAVLVGVFGAVCGVRCAVCGVGIGWGYGVLLRVVMQPLGITVLDLPWGLLGIFVGAGALAGVAASIGPAVRAARLAVLHAIAAE